MSSTRVITPPLVLPVSLAEACAQVRIEVGMDDATVTRMIQAAESYIANTYGVLTTDAVYEHQRADGPCMGWDLPRYPVTGIESVEAQLVDGTVSSVPLDIFGMSGLRLNPPTFWIKPASRWPSEKQTVGATARFIGGWGPTAADIPPAIKHAILLLTGAFYQFREEFTTAGAIKNLPVGLDALLSDYRIW